MATGYGAYIAQPLLRKAVEGREDDLTEEQAREIIEQSLRVLFYRDARSLHKVSFSSTYVLIEYVRLICFDRSIKLLPSQLPDLQSRNQNHWRRNGHLRKEFVVMAHRHSSLSLH